MLMQITVRHLNIRRELRYLWHNASGKYFFLLNRVLFMLMQITVRHLNIRRTGQNVQSNRP